MPLVEPSAVKVTVPGVSGGTTKLPLKLPPDVVVAVATVAEASINCTISAVPKCLPLTRIVVPGTATVCDSDRCGGGGARTLRVADALGAPAGPAAVTV